MESCHCSACADQGFAWKSSRDGWANSVRSITLHTRSSPCHTHQPGFSQPFKQWEMCERCSKYKFGQPRCASRDLPSLAHVTNCSPKAMVYLAASKAQVRQKLNPALNRLCHPLCPCKHRCPRDRLLQVTWSQPAPLTLCMENAHGNLQRVENKEILHLEPYGSHVYTIHNKQHIFQSGSV